MQTLIECVPNFSEGRDAAKVAEIVRAILAGPGVYLLDQEMDADHNRSVVTFAGTRESVGEAALRGIGRAAELIDLRRHRGAHPRLGATDVVPFVPISGVTLNDCVRIAEWVAEQAWRRFAIPTYLYEAAARRLERQKLENIRRGQFEGVREQVLTDPDRLPDFGPEFGKGGLHPSAGATVVGARKLLIAYNINLATADVTLAKAIARKIRASGGGFPCVKAMGVDLKARHLAQVSMNLTDFETTPIGVVFDAVCQEAAAHGVEVVGSEIVGLIPQRALQNAAVHYLKIENYKPDLVIENRLAKVLAEHVGPDFSPAPVDDISTPAPLRSLVEAFVSTVAADTPTPGGGSVSALAGALAAALGEMVCGVTLRRKSFAPHYPVLTETKARLASSRQSLLDLVDRDARSYQGVIAAYRLPKSNPNEEETRALQVESASKTATLVPFETAELAIRTTILLESLREITIPQAASDLKVSLLLAQVARRGGEENVHTNLSAIQDKEWVAGIERKLAELSK